VACFGIISGTIPTWWHVLELHQVKFLVAGIGITTGKIPPYWYNSALVAYIGITSDTDPK